MDEMYFSLYTLTDNDGTIIIYNHVFCRLMENGLPFCVAEGTLQCPCLENFNGTFCDECANGYFGFPDCNRKNLCCINQQ